MKNPENNGFTLMEVLMALMLIAVVLVPLLQAFSSGILVSSEIKGSNTAAILAQQKIEELRMLAFSSITNETKTAVPSYPAYSRQVLVTAPSTNIKDIKVIVYWKPGEGHETSVSVETFISNY